MHVSMVATDRKMFTDAGIHEDTARQRAANGTAGMNTCASNNHKYRSEVGFMSNMIYSLLIVLLRSVHT